MSGANHLVEKVHRFVTFEAERQMLKEMLLDAIECWQSVWVMGTPSYHCVTSRERLFREAQLWIFGDYKNPPFFSFTQVCDCLGLNPDFIRRRLLEWRDEQSSDR